MTEEWQLVLLDADALLRYLQGKASNRKLRLLSAASGRAIWDWLDDERSRSGVITLEQLADGVAAADERIVAAAAAQAAAEAAELRWDGANTREEVVKYGIHWWAANAVAEGLGENPWWGAREAVSAAGMAKDWANNPNHAAGPQHWGGRPMGEWENALALEVFGNHFRPYAVPEEWPAHVIQLADAVYNGADCGFALHDALLDAGHPELAEHFRQEQTHPKGCWVVDRILNKK